MVRIISLWMLLAAGNLFCQDFYIKSLQTYANRVNSKFDQKNFPIINTVKNKSATISIEFDIDADYEPSLSIIFKFCDRNWKPYENIFLENPLHNQEYNLYFERLPQNITGAAYHYKGSFPNENVTFPFSGKWIYYITSSNDPNEIHAEGKFIVINQYLPIKAKIVKNRMENRISSDVERGRVLNLSAGFKIPDSLYPGRVLNVEVIKNHEIYDPILIKKDRYDNDRYYDWDGDRDFTFFAKDIMPGKNYRRLNLNNISKYSAPEANAQFEGVEISRYTSPNKQPDNFGGSVYRDFRDDYAEYLDIKFRLRLPDFFDKDVFVVGSFSDWDLYDVNQLKNDKGLYSTVVELKRGVYDYQYVTAYFDGQTYDDIDWIQLEGNDWSTRSEYRIFVYYKNPEFGEFDEIIGYTKILSGEK